MKQYFVNKIAKDKGTLKIFFNYLAKAIFQIEIHIENHFMICILVIILVLAFKESKAQDWPLLLCEYWIIRFL